MKYQILYIAFEIIKALETYIILSIRNFFKYHWNIRLSIRYNGTWKFDNWSQACNKWDDQTWKLVCKTIPEKIGAKL